MRTGKINRLRAGRLSPWWLRTKQLGRVLGTGKQGAAALVFGVFSLIVGLVLRFSDSGLMRPGLLIIAALVILILSAIAGGKWALQVMSPSDYAQSAVGCTASETLQLISLDIKEACEQFRKQASPFLVSPEEVGTPDEIKRLKPIHGLKRKFAKSHGKLLRISALLKLASEQLDIPGHRLRELLLDYDPAMHRAHAREFIQNLEMLSSGAELTKKHRDHIVNENDWIVERADGRIEAQRRMLEYTALHSSILRMAAVHSTAQAAQEYARAISHVAKLTYDAAPVQLRHWNSAAKDELEDGMAALYFLACKQRTHSGFDLNETCLSMTRVGQLENKREALMELGKSINKGDGGRFHPGAIDVQKCDAATLREIRDMVGNLRGVWTYAVECIQADRNRIVGYTDDTGSPVSGSFERMYGGWEEVCAKRNPNIKNTLLVTHGFSTTVREVFKRGLPVRQDPPDIFVIGSGDPADLDSRLMVSALLEVPLGERRFRRVAAGDKNTLAKLVEKDTKVMVVLGVECFDKKGRVLHPWGLEDRDERWIKRRLGDREAFCVVAVAEGYKFHSDLLSNPQAFRHHLDRVQLYEPKLIDVIVTTDVKSAQYDPRSAVPTPCGHPQPNQERRDLKARDKHILRRPVSFVHPEHEEKVGAEFNLSV